MKKLLGIAALAICFCSTVASGQVLTGGQILPTNAITYIPATNASPSVAGTLSVNATGSTIANLNLSATNQWNGTAWLTLNGVFVCQLIQTWGTNQTVAATNLTYNPITTNNSGNPDYVYTLPTNLTFGITYGIAITNNGSTNVQATINRFK
jgi:hypothetical protein